MTVQGFLNLNKPRGVTSHDVVEQARRAFGIKKIGHAGTLDPLADGVLILCLGNATRLSAYVMQSTKRYRARVCLGVVTDTYDAGGQITQERDASGIQQSDVERALAAFLGDIEQVPPMYSAIKRGGRKLYELARAGKDVEREARPVQIKVLTVTDWSPPEFILEVTCSAGTYIRSLAYDLGETLGVGAHLSGLTRVASGTFTLEKAIPPDTLFHMADWQSHLIPPSAALADWPSIYVDAEAVERLGHGRSVPVVDEPDGPLAFAYEAGGALVAIVHLKAGDWWPNKVFLEVAPDVNPDS